MKKTTSYQKLTVRLMFKQQYKVKAKEKLDYWANLLGFNKEDVYDIAVPQDARGSVDAIDKIVKAKYAKLFMSPAVMAKILGAKDE